jgi:hypothetical protein
MTFIALVAQAPSAATLLVPSAASLLVPTIVCAQTSDDADFKTEAKFHRLYKKFNEQPTSNEAWEKALANRKANSYPIQKNDTLWDISHTFFGDSNYWPKIWSYNTDNILNPHEISPKNMIKFYPGTMSEAPTVGLADATAAPDAMPKKIIEKNANGTIEGIQIPPPKRHSRPVVKILPDSLPLYRLGNVNRPPLEFESDTLVKKPLPLIRDLSRYITDQPVNSVGEVVEAELASGVIAADYQYVVVKLANPGAKTLLAVNDETRVSDPFVKGSPVATVVEVQGEIQILDKVSDSENLYRAVIKKIIEPLEIGDKLLEGSIQTFDAMKTPVTSAFQARIIGGENHRYIQNLFSDDTLVFLNAGGKEGLQVGTTLPIYLNERLRNPKSHAQINDRMVGVMKVVKVADHFATAYIVRTETELMVGDYVGGRNATTAASAATVNPQLDKDGPPVDDPKASGPSEPNSEASPNNGDELNL